MLSWRKITTYKNLMKTVMIIIRALRSPIMWSRILLCLCVGLAYANNSPAWRDNSESIYEVRGKTLTSLHEVSNYYSGIFYKSELRIQSRPDGNLQAKLSDPLYSRIQQPLSDGWNTYIPDSELSWQPLQMSSDPFQILLENGVVMGVTVNKKIPNWEANMIKGIVSQFQVKVQERSHSSEENWTPFNVMEDTVTGSTETSYKIIKMPDHMIQQEPQAEKLWEQKQNEDVYEVTKYKNYSNSVELPSYFYGFAYLKNGPPATNKMGSFLTRASFGRAVITGKPNRYSIYNSFTVSEILVNPTLIDNEKGSVYSMVNVTLVKSGEQQDKIQEIRDPIHLDNLVYSYGKPFEPSNEARQKHQYYSPDKHNNVNDISRNMISRLRRSLDDSQDFPGSEESYKQEQSELQEAPESPMLRFTAGNNGQSIKQKVDIVKKAHELATEISHDITQTSTKHQIETLEKFTILASLVRIMNYNEIKKVADELNNNAKNGGQSYPWKIYRDAVAESGTGPALLAIQDWIQSDKIESLEVSLVLSTMSRAARQPTVQYIKSYMDLIKTPKVKSNWPLNDTAILSFTQLLRHVYISKQYSKTNYPVKSFKNFRNQEGMEFLKNSVVPYFSEELHHAISEAQTHKIHVYIRALGNIATPEIFSAFEPYLEGEKQASQFQRLLMVLAMNHLAKEYPEQTRPVLMRLYENTGEIEDIRVAAVYQILHTRPSVELLQHMASYTNIDKHEQVNAAVKSVIESLVEVQGPEMYEIRKAAKAAMPLLNKKAYGLQYGADYIHKRVVEELKMEYVDSWDFFGSEGHYYPKGVRFQFNHNFAGMRNKLVTVQAMVSSLEELVRVAQRETFEFSQNMQQQQQNHQHQLQHQYSSQKIGEQLQLKREEREQLEGNLYIGNDFAEMMLAFDNNTVHKLFKEFSNLETDLQTGKHVSFLKMSNTEELAVAFPTEMGLPFLYTYDTPSLTKLEGQIKLEASPRMTQEKVQFPDTMRISADLTMSWASAVQGRISFLTPFEHQQYVSAHNKHLELNIPLKGKLEYDSKKQQATAEFEQDSSSNETVLFHYCSAPSISRVDILKCETSNPNSHYIQGSRHLSFNEKFGYKDTGATFRVQINNEKPFFDVPKIRDLFSREGLIAAVQGLYKEVAIQKSDVTVLFVPQESSTKKCVIKLDYESDYSKTSSHAKRSSEASSEGDSSSSEENQGNDHESQSKVALKRVSQGIDSCKSEALDLSVQFEGQNKVEYSFTGAYAKSNIDPKSRVFLKYRKRSADREPPYQMTLRAENVIENTNGLDMDYSLKHEPKVESKIEVAFGKGSKKMSKIRVNLDFERSEERKQFLKEQPLYKQCRFEMREGDNQLPACANITIEANLMDRIQAKVQYENLPSEWEQSLEYLHQAAQYQLYPNMHSNQQQRGRPNELLLNAEFDSDLRSLNVSLKTEKLQSDLYCVPIHPWVKQVAVVHPVFHMHSRLVANALGLQAYRPFCIIDKNKISTFNNLTYPADVSDKWTTIFQYLPQDGRPYQSPQSMQEQLKEQADNYVVLVKRENQSNKQKHVKITVSSPETEFQVVDVTMKPVQQQNPNDARATVSVNGQGVPVDDNNNYDYGEGYIQVYTLPNGELKAEVRDQFYVLYDGERVKLTMLNGIFRSDTRGLCGQFSNKQYEDFVTPENCYTGDHKQFIESYEIEGPKGQQTRQEMKSKEHSQCVKKESPLYVNVINAENTLSSSRGHSEYSGQCTVYKTGFLQENGETCFSINPLPVCSSRCQPSANHKTRAQVYCVQKSRDAQFLIQQINNGENPDFSQKSPSKMLTFNTPRSCV